MRNAVALAPGFNQLPRDVAGDVERFGDRPPLRDEARQLVRSGEKQSFWQLLDLNTNRQFHTNRW